MQQELCPAHDPPIMDVGKTFSLTQPLKCLAATALLLILTLGIVNPATDLSGTCGLKPASQLANGPISD